MYKDVQNVNTCLRDVKKEWKVRRKLRARLLDLEIKQQMVNDTVRISGYSTHSQDSLTFHL